MTETILKPGWKRVRISDCCDQISDRVDNPSKSGFERFVGLEHMQTREISIREWGSTEEVTSAMKLFKAGDVLVARRNVYLERAARAAFDGVCSGDAIVLRHKNIPCLHGLLPFILNTDEFWGYANSQADGSMSKRLSVARLMDYEFALPPLEEQRKIVLLLESLTKADELSKMSLSKLETVLRSFILKEYELAISNFPKLRVDKVGSITMGRQKAPKYRKGINPHPFLKVANIGDLELKIDKLEEMDFSQREVEKYRLEPGDILLTEGDLISQFKVGRPAIYEGQIEDCCFQNTLIRFRPGPNLNPYYGVILFEGARLMGELAKVANTTTVTHLGLGRFSTVKIPIPPSNIQQMAVDKYIQILSVRGKLRERIKNSIELKTRNINEALG